MAACWCSLAGTSACRSCSNNPYCETPPPVRTNTIVSTDTVLITGMKTNADRIRSMTDEELAEFLWSRDINIVEKASRAAGFTYHCDENECRKNILEWLKQEEVEE